MPTSKYSVWERQHNESAQAFEAFSTYRDMGADRSLSAVGQRLGKSKALMERWSSRNHWQERVVAYDNHLDREKFKSVVGDAREMQKRQIMTAVMMQKKASEAISRMQADQLTAADVARLMRDGAKIEQDTRAGGFYSEQYATAIFEQPESSGDSADESATEFYYPVLNIPDNGRDPRPKGVLAPQAGPQTAFMASGADIVIYGGAAGGGKTYALLMEALRHKDVPGFGGVIFRKNYNQITAEGGLWDASMKLFSQIPGAKNGKTPRHHWDFGDRSKLSFAYLEREEDLISWMGTEIAYIGFDELTHFSKRQFLYMLSRNRSTCGIRPYMRATCNPDADSWVAEFISWWIDQDTGYPIKERSGQIRWMVNLNDIITWHESREAAVQYAIGQGLSEEEAEATPKSVTFIASSITDNKVLMEKDPGYIANLRALTVVDMERLLKGNWKIKAAAGLYFRRTQVEIVKALPTDIVLWARGWDLAATAEDEDGDPAYTAGVLMGKRRNGRYVIADVINKRLSASEVRILIKMTAQADKKKYGRVIERLPQDPGQAGKAQAQSMIKMLSGFLVKAIPESGSKESRSEPLAAQWQAGNVDVLEAEWNDMYFNQLESFPESKFKDMVDASSSAFIEIESGATYSALKEVGLGKESYWRK